MSESVFTKENCEDLKRICKQIGYLMDENVDGALMASQMMMLGEGIKQFVKNPIVESSGLVGAPPCTGK